MCVLRLRFGHDATPDMTAPDKGMKYKH